MALGGGRECQFKHSISSINLGGERKASRVASLNVITICINGDIGNGNALDDCMVDSLNGIDLCNSTVAIEFAMSNASRDGKQ
ncbi:hypothetical protein Hypma_014722 [Hypsizygus marmoreus]|uniref:Uncharacterized protein n=1 Tax=Hypsizygus marmoreus TaxID=39966 RepID=A0A369JB95_HYPMA|nr:hypothetical protein Hypma_014722 [Hypsizygus marmoreus]